MYNLRCGCWRGVGEIVNNDSHLGCPPRLCLRSVAGEVLVQAPGGLLLAAEVTPHPARAPAQAGGHPTTDMMTRCDHSPTHLLYSTKLVPDSTY